MPVRTNESMGTGDLIPLTRRGHFRPYEAWLLAEVVKRLSDSAGGILAQQISSVRKVQRHQHDKVTQCYFTNLWGGEAGLVERFPNTEEESWLAQLDVLDSFSGRNHLVGVWLVLGRLFSLEWDSSPTKLRMENMSVCKFLLVRDPMRAKSAEGFGTVSSDRIPVWIQQLSAKYQMTFRDIHDDRPSAVSREQDYGTILPFDYVALGRLASEIRLGEVTVWGLDRLRRVEFGEEALIVLAQTDSKVVCKRVGSSIDEIVVVELETFKMSFPGVGFSEAIRGFVVG